MRQLSKFYPLHLPMVELPARTTLDIDDQTAGLFVCVEGVHDLALASLIIRRALAQNGVRTTNCYRQMSIGGWTCIYVYTFISSISLGRRFPQH